MTTTRSLQDDIVNILDFLLSAELAVYINQVRVDGNRVSWHQLRPKEPFLPERRDPTVRTYRHWVETGAYSAVLQDGSLLQLTYDVAEGSVVGHRLAYIPCPYKVDYKLLVTEPFADVIDLYIEDSTSDVILRSMIRFDFDLEAAKPGHPAAHMTLNSSHCRIACTAPMHIGRFADFIFRHFYPNERRTHSNFFDSLSKRNIGTRVIADEDLTIPHIHWT